jgi:hypothetical protein
MSSEASVISADYLREQQRLHENPRYGVASIGYAPLVAGLIDIGHCRSLSDYGAGKCNLKKALDGLGAGAVDYRPYDPAFPEYGPPRPADLVTCIDVLEHIEPEHLAAVLDELGRITTHLAFLTVHTGPAIKTLSDGRNAHIIQQPPSWWLPRLCERFEVLHLQSVPKGFFVIAAPLGKAEEVTGRIDLDALARAAGGARKRRGILARIVKALRR